LQDDGWRKAGCAGTAYKPRKSNTTKPKEETTMNQETLSSLSKEARGFAIVFDSCGEIAHVVNEKGKVEPEALPIRLEGNVSIRKVMTDITLLYIESSPGHWRIVNGRRVWVP
jgi:hypothetical protein